MADELEELDMLTEPEDQDIGNCTRLDCSCGVGNITELELPNPSSGWGHPRKQEETGTSEALGKNYDALEENSDTPKYHAQSF